MHTVTLARYAMATRFEIVLHGNDPAALRAAGEEALDEIDRLENQLSLFRPGSEIAQVNARAAREPVRVTPEVFKLLQQAQAMHRETGGAFDVTIAPLVRCWGFMAAGGRVPPAEELAAARVCVGMSHVHLDARVSTVRFAREGVMIDLGAIGKGYAVARAAELLRAAGVTSALLHGGTSTVFAIGRRTEAEAWKVAIERPPVSEHSRKTPTAPMDEDDHAWPPPVSLCDQALSVSAIWGRQFVSDGMTHGHVLDPRTGHPVDRARLAAVVLPSATEADALSTALLVLGKDGEQLLSAIRPGIRTVLLC
jgi:thiamine biosynthesis lipoprotein